MSSLHYHCERCGQPFCAMFEVPDAEWQRYIPLAEQHSILCRRCYDFIVALIDGTCAPDCDDCAHEAEQALTEWQGLRRLFERRQEP